jgi:hypothetical protein
MKLRIETLEDKTAPSLLGGVIGIIGPIVGPVLSGSNCSNGSNSNGSCASHSSADTDQGTGTDSNNSSGS